MNGADLQHRLEATWWGQAALSAVIVFAVGTMVVWNLPPGSQLKADATRLVSPVVIAVGLDQSWGVFAPDPPTASSELRATIAYSNGTAVTWRPPTSAEPVLAPYRIYHWQKLAEFSRAPQYAGLWRPLAVWLAQTHRSAGLPTQVTLIRHACQLPPPGNKKATGACGDQAFYSLAITPADLSGSG